MIKLDKTKRFNHDLLLSFTDVDDNILIRNCIASPVTAGLQTDEGNDF